MSELNRIKIFINHLIVNGVVENQKGFGVVMGYNNESSISQILTGKVKMPDNFIKKLKYNFPEINDHWIETGDGDMLKSSAPKFRDAREVIVGPHINNIFTMSTDQDIHDMIEAKFATHLVEMYEQGRAYPALYVKQMQDQYEKQLIEAQKRIAELMEAIK